MFFPHCMPSLCLFSLSGGAPPRARQLRVGGHAITGTGRSRSLTAGDQLLPRAADARADARAACAACAGGGAGWTNATGGGGCGSSCCTARVTWDWTSEFECCCFFFFLCCFCLTICSLFCSVGQVQLTSSLGLSPPKRKNKTIQKLPATSPRSALELAEPELKRTPKRRLRRLPMPGHVLGMDLNTELTEAHVEALLSRGTRSWGFGAVEPSSIRHPPTPEGVIHWLMVQPVCVFVCARVRSIWPMICVFGCRNQDLSSFVGSALSFSPFFSQPEGTISKSQVISARKMLTTYAEELLDKLMRWLLDCVWGVWI